MQTNCEDRTFICIACAICCKSDTFFFSPKYSITEGLFSPCDASLSLTNCANASCAFACMRRNFLSTVTQRHPVDNISFFDPTPPLCPSISRDCEITFCSIAFAMSSLTRRSWGFRSINVSFITLYCSEYKFNWAWVFSSAWTSRCTSRIPGLAWHSINHSASKNLRGEDRHN